MAKFATEDVPHRLVEGGFAFVTRESSVAKEADGSPVLLSGVEPVMSREFLDKTERALAAHRGKKLREYRVQSALFLSRGAKILGLKTSELSDVERGNKRFVNEADYEEAMRLFCSVEDLPQ